MKTTREETIIAAQGAKVITPKQLKALITTAKKAWLFQCEIGATDAVFDAWRKTVLHEISGYPTAWSFKQITQRDYARIYKRFADLAAMTSTAARVKTPEQDEAARARWSLRRECEKLDPVFGGEGAAWDYAESLAEREYGVLLRATSADIILRVLFTIKARAKAKHEKNRRPESVVRSPKPLTLDP